MGRRAGACFGLAALAASIFTNAVVSAEELVRFESAPFRVSEIQQRLAQERGETLRAAADTVQGYLSKPEGSGPFAAIVYLHGCAGLSENARNHISQLMTGWGYVSLAVDSFATRGIKEQCTHLAAPRLGDALGALSYLSDLPFVDSRRIAVVGSSQGGVVALQLVSTYQKEIFDARRDLRFSAAVAYYPTCGFITEDLILPALVLIGELDDWTPAEDCREMVNGRDGWGISRRERGAPVKLIVLPGAYHAFDAPDPKDPNKAHHLEFNQSATDQSSEALREFLDATIGEKVQGQ